MKLDRTDHQLLDALRRDGRASTLELAEAVGLSATACGRRVKRMEDAGVILGYAARVNPVALGLNISVLVSVRLSRHGTEGTDQFLSAVAGHPEITECMLVTGNIDYILRVWVTDIDALGRFIRETLQSIPAVAETSTLVILNEDAAGQGR